MSDSTRLVIIGEIGRPYGRAGEVHVTPLTDDPDRFARVRECVVVGATRTEGQPQRLTGARRHGAGVIVALAGYGSPEQARALTGRFLAIPESEALPVDDAHFYPWQLEGCQAVTEDGRAVGLVARIEHTAAHDLWVIQGADREHLVPAVTEIVRELDLSRRRVVISPPEGLLEL